MQDYNLTNEIKKISGAINNSSPNTELGNINGSVGNLDTAMQGVATAIGNISIPNTGSNIDGVATAINNKTIPDPNTALGNIVGAIQNIPDTTTALGNIVTAIQALNLSVDTSGLMALDGSHSSNFIVSDCNDDLTGIFFCDNTTANMPLGQIGFANEKLLISIGGPTPGVCNQLFISHDGKVYTRQYILGAWGSWALLKASGISYTDTNNIGKTDVQGALDFITKTNSTTGFIKTDQVTITTDGTHGVAPLGKTISDVTMLSIFMDSAPDIPLLFRSGINWYVKVVSWMGTSVPMTNQTYDINLVYVEN